MVVGESLFRILTISVGHGIDRFDCSQFSFLHQTLRLVLVRYVYDIELLTRAASENGRSSCIHVLPYPLCHFGAAPYRGAIIPTDPNVYFSRCLCWNSLARGMVRQAYCSGGLHPVVSVGVDGWSGEVCWRLFLVALQREERRNVFVWFCISLPW